jgi:hypothetical protein
MAGIADQILEFTASERGMRRDKVKLGSRLLQDLGMDGDDAVEFFEKFGSQFRVDLTQLWKHWRSHFGPEAGWMPWAFLFARPMVPITVQDLAEAAEASRWLHVYAGESNQNLNEQS